MEKSSGGLTLVVLLILTVLRQDGTSPTTETVGGRIDIIYGGKENIEDLADVAGSQLYNRKEDGHIAGTRKIRDADAMLIGFPERNSFVRENMHPLQSSFPIFRMIHSLRASELEYIVEIKVVDSTATISAADEPEMGDASFGARGTRLNVLRSLSPGEQEIEIMMYITNDFDVEDNETFTLRVSVSPSDINNHTFQCYEDGEDPVEGNYFCSHTITIVDEDEPFVVSFEHSVYEVAESAGQVEVCVVLTSPDTDIFENVVAVEVYEDEMKKTNEQFPNGAEIANGDPSDADYEKQQLGSSAITNERITEFNRRICYNQTIYDDTLPEPTEYAGLTLKVQDHESMGGPTTAETVVGIGHAAIKILDDDSIFIGFLKRRSVVRENMHPLKSSFPIYRTIHSLQASEVEYVLVSIANSSATISEREMGDASFGTRDATTDVPFEIHSLSPDEQEIEITIYITNDFDVEDNETFTLRVSEPPSDISNHTFQCYEDGEDPVEGNYFCSHTITIVDEDEPFVVSFEHSVYEVAESAGQVEVCVVLTSPDTDILDNVVGVEVYEDKVMRTNEHFPNDAAIANGDPSDADYERQEVGFSAIRKERITELNRKICYNQTIYDDTIVESTEYAGLTLKVQDHESMGGPTTAETVVGIGHAAIKILDDDIVTLGFNDTFYEVKEGESIEICLTEVTAELEKDIVITVESSGGTATSGEDYTATPWQLTFGPNNYGSLCITFEAATDLVSEDSETLTLKITTTDQSLDLNPSTATITILDNTNLAAIIAIPIVVTTLLAVVIVLAIIIGIVCYKRRKQQRLSAKQEFEMPERAAGEKPSEFNGTSQATKPSEVRRVSSEYVDVGYPPPLEPIKMEKNVVYGVGRVSDPDQVIYEEVVEDGEYEPLDPQAPQPQSPAPDVMKVNVAYGVVKQKI